MRRKDPPDDYEVGYRKPPRAKQFQPGQSGNPRGRPRNNHSDCTGGLVERVFLKRNDVMINGKRRKLSDLEVTFMRLSHMAKAGDLKACKFYLEYAIKFGVHLHPGMAGDAVERPTVIRLRFGEMNHIDNNREENEAYRRYLLNKSDKHDE